MSRERIDQLQAFRDVLKDERERLTSDENSILEYQEGKCRMARTTEKKLIMISRAKYEIDHLNATLISLMKYYNR